MKTIICNGAFDVIHLGHLSLLDYAKEQGDRLIVALDTDRRIRSVKGHSRPFNDQETRRHIMEHIKGVDVVCLFDSDEELIEIFKKYEPDIRIIGSDWKGKTIVGEKYCKDIIFFDHNIETSTSKNLTNFIRKIIWEPRNDT